MTNACQKYLRILKRKEVSFHAVEVGVGVDDREESEDWGTNLALGDETGSLARLSWYVLVRVKRDMVLRMLAAMRAIETGTVWIF